MGVFGGHVEQQQFAVLHDALAAGIMEDGGIGARADDARVGGAPRARGFPNAFRFGLHRAFESPGMNLRQRGLKAGLADAYGPLYQGDFLGRMPRAQFGDGEGFGLDGHARQLGGDFAVGGEVEGFLAGLPVGQRQLPAHRRAGAKAKEQMVQAAGAIDFGETIFLAQGFTDRCAFTGPAFRFRIPGGQQQEFPVSALLGREHQRRARFVDAGEIKEIRTLAVAVAIVLPLGENHRDPFAHLLHEGRAAVPINGRFLGLPGFREFGQRGIGGGVAVRGEGIPAENDDCQQCRKELKMRDSSHTRAEPSPDGGGWRDQFRWRDGGAMRWGCKLKGWVGRIPG